MVASLQGALLSTSSRLTFGSLRPIYAFLGEQQDRNRADEGERPCSPRPIHRHATLHVAARDWSHAAKELDAWIDCRTRSLHSAARPRIAGWGWQYHRSRVESRHEPKVGLLLRVASHAIRVRERNSPELAQIEAS